MAYIYDDSQTYTGEIVNFTSTDKANITSVSVPLTYTQDLHGYANPWPAGGGVNKYGGGLNQYNTTNVTTDVMSLPAGTYTFSVEYNGVFNGIYVRNGSTISSASLAVAYSAREITFTLSEDYETVMIQLYKSGDGVSVSDVTHPQLELGSTQTEWMPYENICPISGLTGLSVYVSPTQDPDDATVYNVDWTTQAGTVYGGTVDVVTGVLTVDRASVDLGSISWTYQSRGR